ncbi:MAG: SDR family oxidoreductase [Christensenellales bacterium]|jgi:NADP-dependent 3-hydroxy acid dehydrogenase YdfG
MKEKVVLITGGTSGYGKAMATLFAKEGARVIITARNKEGLNAVSNETGCDTVCMDVTDYDAWKSLQNYVLDNYGHIDVLINNAGGGVLIKPVAEQTKESIDYAILLNLNSVIYAANVFAPMFMKEKTGTIINISSVCARQCWPEWSVYASAKAGVLNFSKGLYEELQPYGVRVTCLIPAAAKTQFNSAAGLDQVDRLLDPMDIAETALYICKLPQRAVVEDVTIWGIDQVVNPL